MPTNNQTLHYFRVTFIDRYGRKPAIDLVVKAPSKKAALPIAYTALEEKCHEEIRLITGDFGQRFCKSADVWRVSPEYFRHAVENSWSIAECAITDGVSHSVSNGKNAKAFRKARWTKEQKAARDAATLKVA